MRGSASGRTPQESAPFYGADSWSGSDSTNTANTPCVHWGICRNALGTPTIPPTRDRRSGWAPSLSPGVSVRPCRYGGPTTGRSTREAAERRKSADELKRAEPGSAPCGEERTPPAGRGGQSTRISPDADGRVWLGQPRVHTGSAERLPPGGRGVVRAGRVTPEQNARRCETSPPKQDNSAW